MKIMFTSLK